MKLQLLQLQYHTNKINYKNKLSKTNMDSSLKDFLNYYNGFIKHKGFEPTAYDVNFWIINFFKSKDKNKPEKNNKLKKNNS